jgi:hypothetical protein
LSFSGVTSLCAMRASRDFAGVPRAMPSSARFAARAFLEPVQHGLVRIALPAGRGCARSPINVFRGNP